MKKNEIDCENYTPQIIVKGGNRVYIQMLLEGEKCHICKKVMIKKSNFYGGIFPKFCAINQEAQAKRSDLVYFSNTKVDDKYICNECESSGKATFICTLCDEHLPTSKIKLGIGTDDIDYLCTDCFSTVPAKIWHEKIEELEEDHRFDNY
jgi:hypothetical protein